MAPEWEQGPVRVSAREREPAPVQAREPALVRALVPGPGRSQATVQ